MKIKLLSDIPVESRHNLNKDMIIDTIDRPEHLRHGVWVQGDGEPIRILEHEYEIVKEMK